MRTLLLKFKAPLQSWAADSRYRTRDAGTAPTKSGVLGLLAAAQGRRRSEPITDLAGLSFGVRTDQPGTLQRDFQTAVDWRKGPPGSLVYRYYLADAVFLAAVAGSDELIENLHGAVRSPQFPLFLGRRSCPANPDLVVGTREGGVRENLCAEPWMAAEWYRRRQPQHVSLAVYRDAAEGEAGDDRRDVPLSFDPGHREYSWRRVVAESLPVENPLGRPVAADPYLEAVTTP